MTIDATPSATRPNVRLVASLLLVDIAVLVLVLGHFVWLRDTSGFGSDEWILPLGALAAGLGVAAVVVAIPDGRARRALGLLILVGVVVLVVLQVTDDGFRFVWAGDDGELVIFELALTCLGLVLLATGLRASPVERMPGVYEPAQTSWTVRALLYLAVTVALVLVAGLLGASYGDAQCTGEGDDCLAVPAWSLAFALVAFAAMVIVVISCEVTLWARRRGAAQ